MIPHCIVSSVTWRTSHSTASIVLVHVHTALPPLRKARASLHWRGRARVQAVECGGLRRQWSHTCCVDS